MQSEVEITCPLCGGQAELKYDRFPGYQEPETFEIFHCQGCRAGFSMPRIKDTQVIYDNIYRHGELVPAYKRYWKYAEEVKKAKDPLNYLAQAEASYWGVREALKEIAKERKGIRILEAGSGLGYLTYSLNRSGYQAFGLDISETSVAQAKKNYGDYYFHGDLFEYAGTGSNLFDVVIATEVIEHLNDPLVFVEALLKLLKPGGHLMLTTPNKSFFPEEIIWATENPPVHCWWFSEESMNYMADKTGTKNRFVDLSGYYDKHFYRVDLNIFRNGFPLKPTLTEMGDVIAGNVSATSQQGSLRRFLIAYLPQLNSLLVCIKASWLRKKSASEPNILVCKKRGVVFCALFTKQA